MSTIDIPFAIVEANGKRYTKAVVYLDDEAGTATVKDRRGNLLEELAGEVTRGQRDAGGTMSWVIGNASVIRMGGNPCSCGGTSEENI